MSDVRKAPRVSHPLVITSDDQGNGKALFTVPFDMTLRSVRAYTSDPAGLRVCRLGLRSTGGYGSPYWSPYDESTEVLPPLAHLVAPEEHPEHPCAFTGMQLKAGAKFDFVTQRLEGRLPYTIELTLFADPTCAEGA